MESTFSWLDYSEHERQQMLDVINLFREQDTRDELGLAGIRDAFADRLFPGTGTVQTRAKYFLFVPWIYMELERKRTASRDMAAAARKKEVDLINVLSRSDDTDGVIGIEARESLLRLPSNIYWLGLGAWGIRPFDGSQDLYHRSLDYFYKTLDKKRSRKANDSDDSVIFQNWNPEIPPAPTAFPEKASFKLNVGEAKFLQEQVLTKIPETMLAEMLLNKKIHDNVDFPWEFIGYATLSKKTKETLEHARNFSEIMHGAPLLYNLMLAEKAKGKKVSINGVNRWSELIRDYQDRIANWFKEIHKSRNRIVSWDREEFWHIALHSGIRISPKTKRFIDTWINLVLAERSSAGMITNELFRKLIIERETGIKRGQARLTNIRALEKWNGAAGIRQMTYRWSNVQVIVKDIQEGLQGGRH